MASCQDNVLEGERCNDVILYDIMKKAAKTSLDPAEIRQNSMETMKKVFPVARSMGCICTDHKFQFPDFVNHRYCSACRFRAQVRSETDRDIWAQFTWPNKTESEIFTFTKFGETRNFTVTGTMCNLAPTVLKSWEKFPKKADKPTGQTSAHLEGNGGTIFYKILAKDGPAAVRSEGMLCAWGQCRLG
ncbi:unnamed protein product [Caenorhabditis sp. 36 PRJEB53466]|nr:unnamed protein product [Caenorhabditis sp. 36 PRJEB53466]